MDKKNRIKIPVARPDLSGKEAVYVLDAIKNEGRISSSGKYLDRFEEYGRKFFKRKHALSCSNGTTALHLALLGLEIGPGDEVIVPVLTFTATAAAVVHAGAKPVFIDCNLEDWTIDIKQLDKKLTPKTKAVISVDLFGMPCNYEYLENWCKKNKVFLIEDAAEAHGAYYKGKPTGSFGQVSCFSFYGNKIITTGEGGLCLTDDQKIYERMKVFKNHGMKSAGVYESEVIGYNYRLTNVQAAIGCAQFERFKEFLAKRKKTEELYKKLLSDYQGIVYQKYDENKIKPACWLFSLLFSDKKMEYVRQELLKKGIETRTLFKPFHWQEGYRPYITQQQFPNAEYIYEHGVSLPTFNQLTDSQIKYICAAIKNL